MPASASAHLRSVDVGPENSDGTAFLIEGVQPGHAAAKLAAAMAG
jgi:hypothetical protein